MNSSKVSVHWSRAAQGDLESIIDYIAQDSIANARNVLESIKSSSIKLGPHPFSGRVVPELQALNIESYREVIASHWRVIYRASDTEINVLAVLDSRRDLDDALLARMLRR